MAHVSVSHLGYAHPGGDELFSGVSFKLAPGAHVGLVGVNGVGKSTLLRILAGELEASEGEANHGGRLLFMAQDVGVDGREQTVRELLLSLAPELLRGAGGAIMAAEDELTAPGGDAAAGGIALGEAIADWSALGGYELEAQWDVSCRRIVRAGFDALADRPALTLSGGERKQLVLDVLLRSDADVLLLDEPDNFLDVRAKLALERAIRESRKTILMISHDRDLLAGAVTQIVTLEGHGAWVHGSSYASYPEARQARQKRMGDAVRRWRDEEKRLREQVRLWKERAKYSDVLAPRANAMETRWKRFVELGPPPAPVVDQAITVRIRGGDSARIVLALRNLGIRSPTGDAQLVCPFSDEIHFGERVGVIGPNGGGKTALMRTFAAAREQDGSRELRIGPRVSSGLFSQLQTHPAWSIRPVLEIACDHVNGVQAAMAALARYGLADAARRPYDVLSGGQKARLEVLVLELDGHNLLLLDEPTDNLDIDSSEALEAALETFTGTVVAVSHDRAFLRTMDRYLMVLHDGSVLALAEYDSALQALLDPERATEVRLARRLSQPGRP
ncbi:MAG: ATP-binding cassette domain-containing protein [Solirubrobacteraceae bacterium]